MSDKAVRYRGLTCTAWGYFFLNFDFHIGAISILPRFVGFLLLLCAINFLLQEHKDLILLAVVLWRADFGWKDCIF